MIAFPLLSDGIMNWFFLYLLWLIAVKNENLPGHILGVFAVH